MEQKKLDVNKLHLTYDAIKELYLNYCEELNQEKKNLEKIENDMKEIKDYLSYLENHQNSDAFVFSPRGVISKNSSSLITGIPRLWAFTFLAEPEVVSFVTR